MQPGFKDDEQHADAEDQQYADAYPGEGKYVHDSKVKDWQTGVMLTRTLAIDDAPQCRTAEYNVSTRSNQFGCSDVTLLIYFSISISAPIHDGAIQLQINPRILFGDVLAGLFFYLRSYY